MKKSIYQTICDNITGGILDPYFSLPEENPAPSGLRLAAGAWDGMYMYHGRQVGLSAKEAKKMARALKCAGAGDYEGADALFAEWTKDNNAVRIIDELQKYVIDHARVLAPGNVFRTALSLVTRSAHVECVKIGLELLEILKSSNENVKDIIRRTGLCEEFTLFVVWNMMKWENGNEEIFRLAKKVHSWGRIHAVERLQPETEEIRRWLLMEGTVNGVMNAYSSLTCWEKSRAEAVLSGHPTGEEYKALGTLIEGLLDEGPAPGISQIGNAEEVLQRFLDISANYDRTVQNDELILSIRQWMEENKEHKAEDSFDGK
jgi:hypothetical protein